MAGPGRARQNNSGERRNESVRVGSALQRSDPNAGRVLWRNGSERSARLARRLSGENDGRGQITDGAVETSDRSAQPSRGAGVAKAIRALDAGDQSHFATPPGNQ